MYLGAVGRQPLRIFSGYFKPFGLFPFCKVIFGDPPKIPFKNKHKIDIARVFFNLARLFLPCKVKG